MTIDPSRQNHYRQQFRSALQLDEQLQAVLPSITSSFRPSMSELDQYDAAKRDTRDGLGRIADHEGTPVLEVDVSGDKRQLLRAATLTCMPPCIHLVGRFEQPSVVLLPARRLICNRCAADLTLLGEDAIRVIANDRCDICCDRVPDNVFTKVRIADGNRLYIGDVCERCHGVLYGGTRR